LTVLQKNVFPGTSPCTFLKMFILWGVRLIVEPGHEIYGITHGIYINNFHYVM